MNVLTLNGLTFVLPLLVIAGGCLIVCLRAVREREQRDRMPESWLEKHRTGDA